MRKEKLSYSKYLKLDSLLASQYPKSKEAGNEVHDVFHGTDVLQGSVRFMPLFHCIQSLGYC